MPDNKFNVILVVDQLGYDQLCGDKGLEDLAFTEAVEECKRLNDLFQAADMCYSVVRAGCFVPDKASKPAQSLGASNISPTGYPMRDTDW